jgi:hypothetical protein
MLLLLSHVYTGTAPWKLQEERGSPSLIYTYTTVPSRLSLTHLSANLVLTLEERVMVPMISFILTISSFSVIS